MSRPTVLKTILTETLEIAFEDSGPINGKPVILLHGFPDDPRSWDSVVEPLTAAGFRTLVPYLRGFGPTRFFACQYSSVRATNGLGIRSEWVNRWSRAQASDPGRLRLGCAGGMYRVRSLAREGRRASLDWRLQHPRSHPRSRTRPCPARIRGLVSMVLPYRPREGRTRAKPTRDLSFAMGTLVPQLEVYRCTL